GQFRLRFAPSSQQSLHNQLIGAMARGGEKSAADDSRPERVRPVEVGGEVEDAELACARRLRVNGGPPAGNQVQDGKQSNERARKINGQLYDIGPDDGGHSAL